MPGGDRTGPTGLGPKTGRGAGYCSGYSAPGNVDFVRGRGYAGFGRLGFRGRGGWCRGGFFRFGYGRGPYAWPYHGYAHSPKEELEALQNEEQFLEEALQDIRKRIDDLETAQNTQ